MDIDAFGRMYISGNTRSDRLSFPHQGHGPRLNDGGDEDAAAFSQYPRRVKDAANPWKENSIIHHNRSEFTHMGYSVRTAEWRLTMWVVWDGTRLAPIWSNVTATELYDHRGAAPYPTDFDASENENVAANASHAAVVAELGARLRAMFP